MTLQIFSQGLLVGERRLCWITGQAEGIGVHTVNKLVSIEAFKESKVEFILVTNEPMNAKNVISALKSKSVLQTTFVHNICNHFKGDTNSMKFYKNEEKSED